MTDSSTVLCIVSAQGECHITADVEGQNPDGEEFQIQPDVLYNMASYLITACNPSKQATTVGGYITADFANTMDYISTIGTNLDTPSYPANTTFFTVAVSATNSIKSAFPGQYHPYTGAIITQYFVDLWLGAANGTTTFTYYQTAALRFINTTLKMTRGGNIPWWQKVT